MAREPKVKEAELPVVEPVTETITYMPGDGDPPSVKWGGHTFQANVPKEITGHAEGNSRDQLNMQIIESARTNKHFRVGNAQRKRDAMSAPQTAEEYRAYAVGWIKDPSISSTKGLIERLAKDRTLQMACEVGTDDYSYISTLFMPRLHELARADELTDNQVADIWFQSGFTQLPW